MRVRARVYVDKWTRIHTLHPQSIAKPGALLAFSEVGSAQRTGKGAGALEDATALAFAEQSPPGAPCPMWAAVIVAGRAGRYRDHVRDVTSIL
jgi:hypothetical protein